MNASKNWIRAARVAAGLSQAELGSQVGTTNSAISLLESGFNTPSIPTLYRIAVLLGNDSLAEVLAPFVAANGESLHKNREARA